MAQMAKKIYLKNSAGTQQTCNLYSTTGEVGAAYAMTVVDNTNCYVPLVATNAATATSGRVFKNNTTYAMASTAVPPYNYSFITAVGGGTFTVPANVSKLRVTCVGGGAGGLLGRRYYDTGTYNQYGAVEYKDRYDTIFYTNFTDTNAWVEGTRGGTTTFGSVSAAGATPAMLYGYKEIVGTTEANGDTGPDIAVFQITSITGSCGSQNMPYYTDSKNYYPGAPAVQLTNYLNSVIGTAGAGGTADDTYGTLVAPGASGYKTVTTINVNPGQKISYTVGNYGYGWKHWQAVHTIGHNSNGSEASRGTPGAILVEWGQGIQ